MPYKDLDKQRAAQRKWYRRKYQSDPSFRDAESNRGQSSRANRTPAQTAARRKYIRAWMREYRENLDALPPLKPGTKRLLQFIAAATEIQLVNIKPNKKSA